HAEQLSNLGGAALAASCGALSADHLEHLDAEGARAMARAGTVAVLLPGAFYFLREKQAPPVSLLREAGVRIAIATDCNPGSSPLTSLLLVMNMACTLFGLTPEEALAGATREAAAALGLSAEIGTIEPGKRAEFAVWDVEHPAELAYRMGFNPLPPRFVEPCPPSPRPARYRWPISKRSIAPGPPPACTTISGRVSPPPRRAWRRSRAARRSMASTPASGSSPACASRPPTPRRCSAT